MARRQNRMHGRDWRACCDRGVLPILPTRNPHEGENVRAMRHIGWGIAWMLWACAAGAAPVTLKIESWRYDDLPVWRDKIIPAFEKAHPQIKLQFAPTPPADYD